MSEEIAVPAGDTAPTLPDAGATPPAGQSPTPTPEPFAVFPDAESLNKRLQREAKRQMNASAKELGYDDWQHMQDELAAQRQAASPAPAQPTAGDAPVTPPSGQDEAQRLRLALDVATELSLPPALIGRLMGSTREEMTADAQRLVAIMQQSAGRVPGIPNAPQGGQQVTFTRAQLQDPAFVRANAAAIAAAGREGRIVN